MNAPVLSLILAASVFGLSGVFAKLLDMPATAIAGFRFAVPTVLLLLVYPDIRRFIQTGVNPKLLAASCCSAFRVGLWVLAFLYAPISKVVVILFTWPIFFALLANWILGETLSLKGWLLLLCALCGVIVFCLDPTGSDQENYYLGMALMFVVAIINAAVLIVFKKLSGQHSSKEILLYDNVVGALIYLPFILLVLPQLDATDIGLGILYGAVIGFLAYSLLFYALPKVKASVWGVISYLEVVTASIFGVLIFGELITWQMLLGAALILIPVMMIRFVK